MSPSTLEELFGETHTSVNFAEDLFICIILYAEALNRAEAVPGTESAGRSGISPVEAKFVGAGGLLFSLEGASLARLAPGNGADSERDG